jgi:hypothetical protein
MASRVAHPERQKHFVRMEELLTHARSAAFTMQGSLGVLGISEASDECVLITMVTEFRVGGAGVALLLRYACSELQATRQPFYRVINVVGPTNPPGNGRFIY